MEGVSYNLSLETLRTTGDGPENPSLNEADVREPVR